MLLPPGKRPIRVRAGPALLVGMAALLAGCASLTYYTQSVTGHLSLMASREPIEEVLAEPGTDAAVRDKLAVVQHARTFASEELALPENRSYRYFAELDRPYAVWNVVATPRYSLEPKRWCFPIAGCVSYRGYFDEDDAESEASELAGKGMDTAVLGATAYSTLGWFADPILSPMLQFPDPELAGLIFHELAHQQLYVSGDTAFNEAFASVVEEVGIERWLAARGTPAMVASWRARRDHRQAVTDLMLEAKSELETLYARGDGLDEAELAQRKAAVFEALRERYRALPGDPEGGGRRLPQDLNNAHLALTGAYREGVPAFRRLLGCLAGDLPAFYGAAAAIGDWPDEKRRGWLEGSVTAPACDRQQGKDRRPEGRGAARG